VLEAAAGSPASFGKVPYRQIIGPDGRVVVVTQDNLPKTDINSAAAYFPRSYILNLTDLGSA
jgi:hypothetical protein